LLLFKGRAKKGSSSEERNMPESENLIDSSRKLEEKEAA
jgi:hypothetical protein